MTQGQAVAAYRALEGLLAKEWPFREAFALTKLYRALRPAYEFQVMQEEKLLKKHGGAVRPGGVASFETVEARQAFEEELAALNAMEQDGGFEPVALTAGAGTALSPKAILALDGFVEFREV